MAKYDPKRPRHAALADEPAQVDALLGGPTQQIEHAVGDGPAEDETLIVDVTDSAMGPDGADAGPVDSDVGSERSGRSDPARPPEVPVAPPPQEGTVNRAVLGAVVATFVALVLAVIVLKRRRAD